MTNTPRERPLEVAEGVYRLGTRWVNFYLVAEGGEFTMVDAGYPGYWKYLTAATQALRTTLQSIQAVIVTHHHADHAGTAERVRSSGGARVLAGEGDAWIVAGKYPSHASPGFYRRCSIRPSGRRFIAHSAVAGGARYRPVQSVESLKAGGGDARPPRPAARHPYPGAYGGSLLGRAAGARRPAVGRCARDLRLCNREAAGRPSPPERRSRYRARLA